MPLVKNAYLPVVIRQHTVYQCYYCLCIIRYDTVFLYGELTKMLLILPVKELVDLRRTQ